MRANSFQEEEEEVDDDDDDDDDKAKSAFYYYYTEFLYFRFGEHLTKSNKAKQRSQCANVRAVIRDLTLKSLTLTDTMRYHLIDNHRNSILYFLFIFLSIVIEAPIKKGRNKLSTL